MVVKFGEKNLNEEEALLVSKFAPIIKVINSLIPKKSALKGQRPASWYFSPEGKAAYDSLANACEKTKFFLNYLCVVQQQSKSVSEGRRKGDEDLRLYWLLYKIAFVMSSSMVDSKLEFGGYPNILDAQKNPFVHYVKHSVRLVNGFDKDFDGFPFSFLHLLHGDKENNNKPIITFLDENEPLTDLYKIERDIITIFDLPRLSDGKLPSVYSFLFDSMTKSNNQIPLEEEIDEVEEEFNEED